MGYVKPDSALVRAATDLLGRHAAQPGGICAACGEMGPCAPARHAIEVRRAAGLPDEISASDPSTGGADPLVGSPLGGGGSSFGAGFGGTSAGAPGLSASPAVSGANVKMGAYGAPGQSSNQPAAQTPVALSKD